MRPPITWLITDTHWYHDAIKIYANRPDDYNERMLQNCLYLVAAQDTLLHLGDVIFYRAEMLKEMLRQIAGRKILVMGNHDRHRSRTWYQRNGFDFACDMLVLGTVLFSHEPVPVFPTGVTVNVHGHFHNDQHRPRPDWYVTGGEAYRLLAMEDTDYKPVNLQAFLGSKH